MCIRDSLRPDDFVHFPAKTVIDPVNVGHGLGRILDLAMTGQAALVVNPQRSGQIQHSSGRGVALDDQFLALGVVAEFLDDVRFPVAGPVIGVGRVELSLIHI